MRELNVPSLTIPVADLQGFGPILEIELMNTLSGMRALQQAKLAVPQSLRIQALVDTGADMTVIDDGLSKALNLTLINFHFLGGGFAGGTLPGATLVPEYAVRLIFPNAFAVETTAIEVPLPSGLRML